MARFEDRLGEIDELLYAEIAEHRTKGDLEDRDDILSALILARFEDGEGMTDTDLRDQLMTLLLAGHETTATGTRLDLRPAAPPPRGDDPPARLARAGRGRATCGRRSPSRCGCGRSCRSPAGASTRTWSPTG